MNLTTKQNKHIAAVYTAASNGEECEWYTGHQWVKDDPFDPQTGGGVSLYPDRWRIAPRPKTVPWEPQDVPAVGFYKQVGCETADSANGFNVAGIHINGDLVTWGELAKNYLVSETPYGTFRPCTKEVK